MTIYKCHNWAFNPQNQELVYDDGQVKQLPSRISNSLNTLLECRGETVLYEQLLLKVWGTTHKDPSTISSVISELRKFIGCGRDQVKLLHTVPKRGYRFVGEVELIDSTEEMLAAEPEDEPSDEVESEVSLPQTLTDSIVDEPILDEKELMPPVRRASWRVFTPVLLGVLISISASIMSSSLFHRQDDALVSDRTVSLAKASLSARLDFDIGGDGRWLLFSRPGVDGRARVVVKDLNDGELYPMPYESQDDYLSPQFSPDMSEVAFIRSSAAGCEVWTIGFDSGRFVESAARRLADCGSATHPGVLKYADDGQSLYFTKGVVDTDAVTLFAYDFKSDQVEHLGVAPAAAVNGH